MKLQQDQNRIEKHSISVGGNSSLKSNHETEEDCNTILQTELNAFKLIMGYEKHLESQIQKLRLEMKNKQTRRNEIKVD